MGGQKGQNFVYVVIESPLKTESVFSLVYLGFYEKWSKRRRNIKESFCNLEDGKEC